MTPDIVIKGQMVGGYDTARVGATDDPAALAARETTRAAARGNLAAWMCEEHGVDPTRPDEQHPASSIAAAAQWQRLLAILGLDPAGMVSGVCRRPGCANTIPLHRVRKPSRFDRRFCCADCATETPPPPAPPGPPPAAPRAPASGARCGFCERDYFVGPSGRLPAHPGWRCRGGAWFRVASDCPGSHAHPYDTTDESTSEQL